MEKRSKEKERKITEGRKGGTLFDEERGNQKNAFNEDFLRNVFSLDLPHDSLNTTFLCKRILTLGCVEGMWVKS